MFEIIPIISHMVMITYLTTGNILQMTSIVVIFQFIQMVIYYFHERAWERKNSVRRLILQLLFSLLPTLQLALYQTSIREFETRQHALFLP